MLETLAALRQFYQDYRIQVIDLTFVWAACIYWICSKKRCRMSFYIAVLLCLIFFRMIPYVFEMTGGSADFSSDLFSCVPAVILIACCFTDLYADKGKRKPEYLVIGLLLLQLLFGQHYTDTNFKLFPDTAGMETEVRQIHDVCVEQGIDKMIAPDEVASLIRKDDIRVNVVHGAYYEHKEELMQILQDADDYECAYVILQKEQIDEDMMKQAGYESIFVTQHYVLFQRDI